MSLFNKKKTTTPVVTDDIPEKIHKRLHLAYFFIICVICAMVFILFWGALCMALLDIPDFDSEDRPFLHHEYCGTFFVEINRENSFATQEDYLAALERWNNPAKPEPLPTPLVVAADALGGLMLAALLLLQKTRKLPKPMDHRYAKMIWIAAALFLIFRDVFDMMTAMLLLFVFLALRSGDKRTIFSNRSSDYFMMGGALWLVGNLVREVQVILQTAAQGEGMTGVFSHPVYYMQLYRIAAIPIIMFCAGLMLRQHELALQKDNTAGNARLLKGIRAVIMAGSGGFILWRLAVRVYELARVMKGDNYTVRLPFTVLDMPYNKLIDLPFEMANTPQDYKNVVLFRFVKDFPVFVLSAVAIFFFVKLLCSVARGELNTRTNRKYLNISMLVLVAASLWFNLMGIREPALFNHGFSNIYGEVVYTVALRSVTEPALYALVLWIFKTYLQAIPEAASE